MLFGVGFLVRSKWGPLQQLDDAIIERDHVVHPRARGLPLVPARLAVADPADQALHRRHAALPVGVAGQGPAHPGLVGLRHDDGRLDDRARREVRRSSGPGRSSRTPCREAPGYSFPSGHALNSAAWATIVVILLWPLLKPLWARVTAVVLAVLVVLVTALDRVLLGVHYPSDVTVGVLTGVGLVLASYAGYVGWNPPTPPRSTTPTSPPPPTRRPDAVPHPLGRRPQSPEVHLRPARRARARRAPRRRASSASSSASASCSRARSTSFSEWENGINRWFQDGRTATGEHDHEVHVDDRQHRVRHRGRRHRLRDRLVAHQGVVVRRRPADRDLAAGHRVRPRGDRRRPRPAERRAARPDPADVELPQRPRRCLDRALRLVRADGDADLQRRRAPGRHRAVHPRAAARVVRPALPRRPPRVGHRRGASSTACCAPCSRGTTCAESRHPATATGDAAPRGEPTGETAQTRA